MIRPLLGACCALLLAACYSPSFDACAVTCTSASGCPSGYECGGNDYCHPTGASDSVCPGVDIDAGIDANLDPPDAMPTVAAFHGLAGAYNFTCGLDADHHLFCWGANNSGQLGRGTMTDIAPMPAQVNGSAEWSSVAAGFEFACGIRRTSAEAWCWGKDDNGQLGRDGGFGGSSPDPEIVAAITPAGMWTSLSASSAHVCGINDGRAYCWGAGTSGQLGDDLDADQDQPVQAGTATDWLSISAGSFHTCGIRSTGALYCWGKPTGLGQSPTPGGDVTAPGAETVNPNAQPWVSVDAGVDTTCAIDATNDLFCWGDNGQGIIHTTGSNPITTPSRLEDVIVWDEISLGFAHACGRAGTMIRCWGLSDQGQAGIRVSNVQPTVIAGTWTEVMAGAEGYHSCGVRTDDAGAACWGWNGPGQLGTGESGDAYELREVIVPAAPTKTWRKVVAGIRNSCALDTEGSIWCWGWNGELMRSQGDQPRPVVLADVVGPWSDFDIGFRHGCAIKSADDSLWCWGLDADGQLGNDTLGGGPANPVFNGGTWLDVDVGEIATCGIKTDETLWCWGTDSNAQLAEAGGSAFYEIPHQVVVASNDWKSVSVGDVHACAVRNDGTAACWGRNLSNAVDDQDTDLLIETPTDLPLTGWLSVDVSWGSGPHSTGLTGMTRLAWGTDFYGRLGVEISQFPVTSPTSRLAEVADWTAVSNGGGHACGLRAGGQLWCWGYDHNLPLGNGTRSGSYVPVRVGDDANWSDVSAGDLHNCAIDGDQHLWCWGPNFAMQIGAGTGMSATPVSVILP